MKNTAKYKESDVTNYLQKNEVKIDGKRLTVLDSEVSIHKAQSVLTRDFRTHYVGERNAYGQRATEEALSGSFGRIDLLLHFRNKNYCCEVKVGSSDCFWSALKIVGYTAYFNWEKETSYEPAIMVPHNIITLEHQIMVGRLKIKIFSFQKTDEGFVFHELSDKPIWHQKINEQ